MTTPTDPPRLPTIADLPLPQGEPALPPTTFDDVAPVMVAFVRTYLSPSVHAGWFLRSKHLLVHAAGCRAGGTPHNGRWIDLVSVPVLGFDLEASDLSKVVPMDTSSVQEVSPRSPHMPSDVRESIRLVLAHDRAWLESGAARWEQHAQAPGLTREESLAAWAVVSSWADRVAILRRHETALAPAAPRPR